MATEALQAESAHANPAEEIHHLATEIQSLGLRIQSLADVIVTNADDAFTDTQEEQRRRHLNNVINFADLVEREAADILAKGGRLEILSYGVGESHVRD